MHYQSRHGGLGDTELDVKYQLLHQVQSGLVPSFSFYTALSVPTHGSEDAPGPSPPLAAVTHTAGTYLAIAFAK